MILVDDGWEVHGTSGQRSHVGLQVQRTAALGRIAATPTGRELDDHPRAVLAHALLHLAKALRVGGGGFIVIAYMDVDERCARLVGLPCALHLLLWSDRNSRVILLAWDRAGDSDGNNNRVHGNALRMVLRYRRRRSHARPGGECRKHRRSPLPAPPAVRSRSPGAPGAQRC